MAFVKKNFVKVVSQPPIANGQPANTEVHFKKDSNFFEHFEMVVMTDPTASGFPISFAARLAAPTPIYRALQQTGISGINTQQGIFDGETSTDGELGLELVIPTANMIEGTYRLQWGYGWNYNAVTSDFVAAMFEIGSGAPTDPPLALAHRQEPKDAGDALGTTGTNQWHSYQSVPVFLALGQTDFRFQLKFGASVAGVNASMGEAWIELARDIEVRN